jgi:hypothetical protein
MRTNPLIGWDRSIVLDSRKRDSAIRGLPDLGISRLGITACGVVLITLFACAQAGAQEPVGLPAGMISSGGAPPTQVDGIPVTLGPDSELGGAVESMPPAHSGEMVCEPAVGPIRRAMRHVHAKLVDRVIGYPELFDEPPPGAYVFQHYLVNKRAALQHRFLLYHSDFWSDTTQLTPDGQERLARMIADLGRWQGPILIEQPGGSPDLAARRKSAIAQQIALAGVPMTEERILVAASPYRGTIGDFENAVYQQWIGIQGATTNYIGRAATYPAGWPTFMPYPVLLAPGGGGGGF